MQVVFFAVSAGERPYNGNYDNDVVAVDDDGWSVYTVEGPRRPAGRAETLRDDGNPRMDVNEKGCGEIEEDRRGSSRERRGRAGWTLALRRRFYTTIPKMTSLFLCF